ncbi:MAG: ATP-dependent helicase, RecQ family [Actinomycetia bacterium]|nr:ATP-dependent helicase, RecQ family [Actinomycetes bacterium]
MDEDDETPGGDTADPITHAAREVFDYPTLRPGQREAIESVLSGRDTLAVLATGAGKSAIYALAGHLLHAATLVISPLIALENDQLLALERRRGVSAVVINSAETASHRREALDRLTADSDRPDYVFLAPEQLANADVVRRLAVLQPALVAVDEAHLVSQWGTDFRPDYLRIAPAVAAIGHPITLALTATAAPPVRQEIIERLGMHDPSVMVGGFSRANIDLAVHAYFTDESHKLEVIVHDIAEAARGAGHGIVYAATRRRVEALAGDCARLGLRAAPYHAGMPAAARLEVEDRFHDGTIEVVVATIAFGMGIDKADIRWVFHADVPGSLDEYYQEIGRAGRDGASARAVLYFRSEDLRLPRMYASKAGPSVRSLETTAEALGEDDPPVSLADLRRRTRLSRTLTSAAATALADAGGLTIDADGRVAVSGRLDQAVANAAETVRRRRAVERTRTDTIEAYAEHVGCRWRFLLEYFGEAAPERCGHCDNDERDAISTDANVRRPFPRGSRIRHRVFGEGEVVGYVGSWILLMFDRAGYKRLDLELVVSGHLLERVA